MTLTEYLSNNCYGNGGIGSDIAKSLAATSGWTAYGTAGTVGSEQASNNSSGFTALPGGHNGSGIFFYIGKLGYWWNSTEYSTYKAYFPAVDYYKKDVIGNQLRIFFIK